MPGYGFAEAPKEKVVAWTEIVRNYLRGRVTLARVFVLILGGSWHSVRRALLGWVKPDGAWARIFPPEAPATA